MYNSGEITSPIAVVIRAPSLVIPVIVIFLPKFDTTRDGLNPHCRLTRVEEFCFSLVRNCRFSIVFLKKQQNNDKKAIKKRRFFLKKKWRKKRQKTTKNGSFLTSKRRIKRRKLMKTKKTTKRRFLTKILSFFRRSPQHG